MGGLRGVRFTEVSRPGTRGMMVRDKWKEQEVLAHPGSSKTDPASWEGGTFKLPVFLPLMHQEIYKHEHWPQKSAILLSLFPLTNGKHRLAARPKQNKKKTELAPSESKDQLVIWLKADVIRTERFIRGSYPSSGHTGSGHTDSDTSFFPENPGERLTSPAEVELSSDSLRQKSKQLHLHNIWVRTTGTECNGRPDTQTCG